MPRVEGSKIVVEALKSANVKYVFGIPGTHNIELYDAMLDEQDIYPILVSDEQSASFMADGVARSSNQLAAINVVPGAGLTHAMSGISECYLDQIPLLVLCCGLRQDTGAHYQLHSIDQMEVVKPVSKKVFKPQNHSQLREMILEACSLAMTSPQGPVAVEVPANLYLVPGEDHSKLSEYQEPVIVHPKQNEIEEVARRLNQSENIAIYCGLGAKNTFESGALVELAEKLDAFVFTTISGKGVFPENNSRFIWNSLGRSLPPDFQKFEKSFDTMIAIGCRFSEVATASYGCNPPAQLIHVDIDESVFSKNYPASYTVTSDANAFVQALLRSSSLMKKTSNVDRIKAVLEMKESIKTEQEKISDPARVSFYHFVQSIRKVCGDQTIYSTDSGNGTFLTMENLKLNEPKHFLAPVDYSCMGYSVPAGIGAKLANPNKPVAILAGDGAFLMTGLEMTTAITYKAGVMCFVLRDGEYSQIAQFQRASLNRETCTEVAEYKLEYFAKALSIPYFRIENNQDCESMIAKAYEHTLKGTPVFVDVNIDYSKSSYFSKGVVKTNFLRFGWRDRIRLVSRVIGRKLFLPFALFLGFQSISANVNATEKATPQNKIERVVMVWGENAQAVIAAKRSFMSELIKTSAFLSPFYALTHPSQPNYIGFAAGSFMGVKNNFAHDIEGKSLWDLLDEKYAPKRGYRIYADQWPGGCSTVSSSGKYVRKHNPAISFLNVRKDEKKCADRNVGFEQLKIDAQNSELPPFSFIVLDNDRNGHDTGSAFFDNVLRSEFGAKTNTDPNWSTSIYNPKFIKNTLFIVSFDEDDKRSDNEIYTVIYNPELVNTGKFSPKSGKWNHFSMNKLMLNIFELPPLGRDEVNATTISISDSGIFK